jgi:hypothetical protein
MPLRSLKTPVLTISSPSFSPSSHGDEIAARLAGADELLAQNERLFAGLLVGLLLDHVDRIAEGA